MELSEKPRALFCVFGSLSLPECHSVHAVPEATGRGSIGKDMPKMGVAGVRKGFDPLKESRTVEVVGDDVYVDRLGKRWPSRA